MIGLSGLQASIATRPAVVKDQQEAEIVDAFDTQYRRVLLFGAHSFILGGLIAAPGAFSFSTDSK